MTTQDQQVKCTDRSASSDLKKSQSFETMHEKQQGHSTGEVAESDKIDHESYSIMEKQSDSAGDISSSYDQPKISRSQSFEFQMNNSNDLEGSTNSAEILGPRYRSFEDLCSVGDGARHSELTLVVQFAEPSCDVYVTSNMEENVSVVRSDAAEEGEQSNTSSGYDEIRDEMHKHGYWKDKSVCSNRSVGPVSPYTDSGDFCHHSDNGDGLNKAMDRESEYAGHNQQSLEVYDSKEISPEAEWEEPETDGVDFEPKLQHNKYMYSDCSELTPRAFSIKRIEDWINQIDIENGVVVEEQEQRSNSALLRDSEPVAGMPTMRHDAKSPLGMEIAYNYISGLAPASSSAQLANLGLVAVPILSAFAGLRLLNLAGNSIVRITAGVLPKGLHMLNLSKNSISTIEGLRELTRLRVLDLSYNRIARIGHGLASCSSLKELYLAGNKISEVDGLHRLLKLKILDVRNNKISTSKGLGQLAANYNSLEAVNVEGNPAQKNVGDEHLKKYLLGLLPHLAYYNKQSVRSSSSKDVSDRHARIVSSSCRSDRGVRSERKSSRSVAAAAHTSQSSWRARSRRASSSLLKPSRTRTAPLPLVGSKPTDVANPMQRIRSKG